MYQEKQSLKYISYKFNPKSNSYIMFFNCLRNCSLGIFSIGSSQPSGDNYLAPLPSTRKHSTMSEHIFVVVTSGMWGWGGLLTTSPA